MSSGPTIAKQGRPRFIRRLSVIARRSRLIPLLELLSVVALIAMVSISYFIITEQYDAMLEHYGPEIGVNCARKHIGWYTRGLHGSAEFRNAFNKEADAGRARAMLRHFYAPWLSKAAA